MSKSVILDVKFLDSAGLFERLKQVRRLATHYGQLPGRAAFSDAVIYMRGPNGEELTRLVVTAETLSDGSTVLNATLR